MRLAERENLNKLVENITIDEGAGFGVLGVGEELFGGGNFVKAAVEEEADAVGEAAGLEDVVGDDDDGGAPILVGLEDDVFDEADVVGVEVGGGFVEEEELGLEDEGAGEGDALGFAAGEFGGGLVGEVEEAEAVEDGGDAGGVTLMAELEAEVDVVADGAAEELGFLEDHGDLVAIMKGNRGVERGALVFDLAVGGGFEEGKEAEEGAFAGAAGANEGEDFTSVDGEGVDIEDKPLVVLLLDVSEGVEWCGHG